MDLLAVPNLFSSHSITLPQQGLTWLGASSGCGWVGKSMGSYGVSSYLWGDLTPLMLVPLDKACSLGPPLSPRRGYLLPVSLLMSHTDTFHDFYIHF